MESWYRPPASQPSATPSQFRSAATLADLATAFLLMLVAVNILDLIDDAIDLPAYAGRLGTLGESTHLLWTTVRNTLVAFSWLLAAFPGSVLFVSLWVHRAYTNLRALGTQVRMSPGMAVAWFFIPVANLWKPYQVVHEIYERSVGSPATQLLAVWWSSWLAGSLIGSIQLVVSARETFDPATHMVPILLSAVSDLLFIAAALLLVRIVRTVTRAQDAPGMVTPPRG